MAWTITEPDVPSALRRHARPLEALAAGETAAIVWRGAWSRQQCHDLVARLVDRQLLYDGRRPETASLLKESIPEGHYLEGSKSVTEEQWSSRLAGGRSRIDVGTSLGYRGSDPQEFFAHSAQTLALFEELFAERDNPIELLYSALTELSSGRQQAVTAHEPDGRRYGPAIIRAHYGGYTYKPHFDSVRLRERREGYAVHEFEHQFAGVLVLQNTELAGRTAQCVLHNCLWQQEVDPHLKAGRFHEYAAQHGIERLEVQLEPGDLYFFNTRMIHEVPGVAGDLPRVVMATFIGFSPDREEIFVWS